MHDLVTPEAWVAELKMLRDAGYQVSWLIVEGSSDRLLYKQFIDADQCKLIIAFDKLKALKLIQMMNSENLHGVVAIVDQDFDELTGTLLRIPNLFFTDTHDLETMLIQSPALEKVLTEFGSEEKILRFGQDIREVLLDAGCTIGYLVWISLQDQLNLTFTSIDYGKFLDDSLKIIELKLIQEIKNKSQRLDLSDRDLQQSLAKQRNPQHDPWLVCRGHDLAAILAYGLRKTLGSQKPTDVTPDKIEQALRLAYEFTYFCQTHLYKALRDWENHNSPYRIFQFKSTD